MRSNGGGGSDWLASSWTAAGLASSLGRALGGSSPLSPPPGARAAEGSGTAVDDSFAPLPPVDPEAEWDDDAAVLDEIPVAEPAQLPLDAFDEAPDEPASASAPAPAPAPATQPQPQPAPAPPVVLLAKAAECGSQLPPAADAAPPGPATPPNEEELAGWSGGLGRWDPTQLLPAEQRDELVAAATSLRAGLPGGGNPAALLGTVLLGTTDRSLRGFAGLMNNGRGGNTEAARSERS